MMKKIRLLNAFQIAFVFLFIATSAFSQSQTTPDVTDPDPDNGPCTVTGINPVDPDTNSFKSGFGSKIYAARYLPDIPTSGDDVNRQGGKIDDRTCTYNYSQESQSFDNNTDDVYGVYRLKTDTNPFDSNALQPRIERETSKINTNLSNPGTRVELRGVVVIRRVGSGSNPGTYICQAKGKFDDQPNPSADPAIALLLVKDIGNNKLKFFLEATQSSVRQQGGADRREYDTGFEVSKNVRVEVIFKNEIVDNNDGGINHRIQVQLKELRNTSNSVTYNYLVPQPTRAKDIKIRFGAYRCWGGEAAIYWKSGLTINSVLSTRTPRPVENPGSNWSNLSEGWYTITPQSNTNMRLALDNGNLVQKWASSSDNSQKFYVDNIGSDTYRIKANNNKYLDIYANDVSNGTKIWTWDYLYANNQQWKFSDGNNGYIYVKSKANLNRGFHIHNYNANNNNAEVNVWDIWNGNNHRFKFSPTSAPGNSNSGSSGGNTTSSSNLLRSRPYLSDFNSGFYGNNSGSWGGQNAVDGNGSTRWASASNGNNPDFIGWDLGANYNISQMKVKWETARGIDFGFVYYSNGSWYYMNQITNNNTLENTANVSVNARYIGIYVTRGVYGFSSAWEIEAYGSQAKSASKKNNMISAIPIEGNFSEIALEEKEITVFPNPVNSDSFTINLKGMKKSEIIITNVLGKVVYKTATDKSSIRINKTNSFKTGLYIVSVKDENNKLFRSKLLVK